MNPKTITLLLIALLLISGCTSSFQNCKTTCYWAFNEDDRFLYNTTCDDRILFEHFTNSTPKYISCEKTDINKLREFCFNECKPK
ncbi:hypothetical protein LCGC14_2707160 [marine sediment metagenome]|uniref:Uncharacterized protein n=1 Tax=marine sediment metagenome TaxID=412755 RepID=A0A0F9A1P4_9ZZZZ